MNNPIRSMNGKNATAVASNMKRTELHARPRIPLQVIGNIDVAAVRPPTPMKKKRKQPFDDDGSFTPTETAEQRVEREYKLLRPNLIDRSLVPAIEKIHVKKNDNGRTFVTYSCYANNKGNMMKEALEEHNKLGGPAETGLSFPEFYAYYHKTGPPRGKVRSDEEMTSFAQQDKSDMATEKNTIADDISSQSPEKKWKNQLLDDVAVVVTPDDKGIHNQQRKRAKHDNHDDCNARNSNIPNTSGCHRNDVPTVENVNVINDGKLSKVTFRYKIGGVNEQFVMTVPKLKRIVETRAFREIFTK